MARLKNRWVGMIEEILKRYAQDMIGRKRRGGECFKVLHLMSNKTKMIIHKVSDSMFQTNNHPYKGNEHILLCISINKRKPRNEQV